MIVYHTAGVGCQVPVVGCYDRVLYSRRWVPDTSRRVLGAGGRVLGASGRVLGASGSVL